MTLAYPICLFQRLRMNMSSTAPRRSYFNALSVASYCLCSLVALANWRRMSEMTEPVLLAGMMGSEPGLAGRMQGVRLRVSKTAEVTVRYNRPSVPSPRWDWTEAALSLSWRCTSAMVLYPG